MIIADACKEFVALAEALQIPVVTTLYGQERHPLEPSPHGRAGRHPVQHPLGKQDFLDSTLVLAVGSRFNDRHTGDLEVYKGSRKFIHVDIDPGQIGKNIMPDLGICADAK